MTGYGGDHVNREEKLIDVTPMSIKRSPNSVVINIITIREIRMEPKELSLLNKDIAKTLCAETSCFTG